MYLRAESGELVGHARGAILGVTPEERRGLVLDIQVSEPYRGRYHGTALYEALREWFEAQRVDEVQAELPMANAGAATFWAMQGFRPQARVCRQG